MASALALAAIRMAIAFALAFSLALATDWGVEGKDEEAGGGVIQK